MKYPYIVIILLALFDYLCYYALLRIPDPDEKKSSKELKRIVSDNCVKSISDLPRPIIFCLIAIVAVISVLIVIFLLRIL